MNKGKFILKENLVKLLDWCMQNGPYRCPKTGSSILKKNAIYIFNMNILFLVCGLSAFNFAYWLKLL